MADASTDPGPVDERAATPPRTPRWVKVFGIVVIALVVVFVVAQLVGGGDHGPARHAPRRHAPPAGIDNVVREP